MRCSQHDLKGYLLGELAEAERRAVEEHLKGCRECAEDLEKLRLAESALRSLPDQEMPYRIAFVSDKIFEPRGWTWLWNSAPRLGFVSAAMLAAALLVHAVVRPAPAPSAAEMAALESRVRAQVTRSVETELTPVMENLQVLQKRATVVYMASLQAESRQ